MMASGKWLFLSSLTGPVRSTRSNWQGPQLRSNGEGKKEACIPSSTSSILSALTNSLAAEEHSSPDQLYLGVRNSTTNTDSVSLSLFQSCQAFPPTTTGEEEVENVSAFDSFFPFFCDTEQTKIVLRSLHWETDIFVVCPRFLPLAHTYSASCRQNNPTEMIIRSRQSLHLPVHVWRFGSWQTLTLSSQSLSLHWCVCVFFLRAAVLSCLYNVSPSYQPSFTTVKILRIVS